MRINFGEPTTPGLNVLLDGKPVAGCAEADDVEGWVTRTIPVPGAPPHTYMKNPDQTPKLERVEGKVEIIMALYKHDDRGNVLPDSTEMVPVKWDIYLQQREKSFNSIFRHDSRKIKEVTALLHEWYGKAKTQDAEARQVQEAAEEARAPAPEAGVGGEPDGARGANGPAAPAEEPAGGPQVPDGDEPEDREE